jgi:hypothetical protein
LKLVKKLIREVFNLEIYFICRLGSPGSSSFFSGVFIEVGGVGDKGAGNIATFHVQKLLEAFFSMSLRYTSRLHLLSQ